MLAQAYPATIPAAHFMRRGIGANLKAFREGAGLTQEELAEKAGVQQSDVSKYETNRVTPDLVSALKLAAALEKPLDSFVKGLVAQYDASRDLLGPTAEYKSTPSEGGADVSASTRVRELQGRVEQFERLVPEIEGVLAKLVNIAAAGDQAHSADGAAAKRRRGHRKAG